MRVMATKFKMLDDVCILHSAYAFGKSMNPIIFPPFMQRDKNIATERNSDNVQ